VKKIVRIMEFIITLILIFVYNCKEQIKKRIIESKLSIGYNNKLKKNQRLKLNVKKMTWVG